MEQSLADKGDGEELIDTKFRGVHLMDSRLKSSQLCLQLLIWHWPAEFAAKLLTHRCTHMEQSLEDKGDGEELMDSKLWGVLSTEDRLQLSQISLQLLIWALAC